MYRALNMSSSKLNHLISITKDVDQPPIQISGLLTAYLKKCDSFAEFSDFQEKVLFKIKLDKVGIDQDDKIIR